MAKCAACGRFVGVKDVAVCSVCNSKQHLACAQLKQLPNGEWQCRCCRKKVSTIHPECPEKQMVESGPNTPHSASSVDSFEDTVENANINVGQEIRLFRKEIQQLREELVNELKDIRREVADLRQTVTSCNKRIDGLECRIVSLESRQEGAVSEDLQSKFDKTVAHLKCELNVREQELLHSDLEISNLPEGSGENVIHTVELVAKKLGVTLETRDIIFAERVGPRVQAEPSRDSNVAETAAGGAGGARPRRVVVRLARRALRDELLQSARTRRGVTSADLGLAQPPRRFYLNERLTRHNKQLFYRTRQAAERLGWRYTWTKRGRIYTKQSDGKRTYSIRTDDDFRRVFPNDVSQDKHSN